MYENQYYGNPFLQQNQQRYAGNQFQMPVQQPVYQPPIQPQPSQIVGRMVDSADAIQANDVPMNMPYALFPKRDLTEIYLKSWNPNGTIQTVIFKPEVSNEENSVLNDGNGTKCIDSAISEQIMRRLDELSDQIQEIGNSVGKPATTSRRKEGDPK